MTTTTVGHLVANLFAKYERRYHDAHLAAIATQVEVNQLRRTGPRRVIGLGEARAAASAARAAAWESWQTQA